MSAVKNELVVWRQTPVLWGAMFAMLGLLVLAFIDGLRWMVQTWDGREEYSYGYLIPFITAFLIWQKKEVLERIPFSGAWSGVALLALGVSLFFIGELSTLYIVEQYAFLIVLAGLALALLGWRGFRVILVPLLVLAFMIPLPDFLLNNLSAQLQLWSSSLGVATIRAFGISVFLEGNVIDLGSMKLQVVEACSGLRYLFPLMAFGFITAYFFKAAFWKRAMIFLSTIPITLFINSVRIGLIGVTVEYWGKSMAEGFLHDFEGWAMFMVCTGVLFAEMWLLTRLGVDRRPLRQVFGLEFPTPTPHGAHVRYRHIPRPFIVAAIALAMIAVTAYVIPERVETVPARDDFSSFPTHIGDWSGHAGRLDQIYVDALKFDDYLMMDYSGSGATPVNLYAAYYGSQQKGQSAHSPRTCIPGGGWEITSLTQHDVAGANVNGQPLRVNRALVELRENKQLVYYWFQQRGRVITNEYLVKWFLLWDALTRNRTDGALVRVMTSVGAGQDIAAAEARLEDLIRGASPELEKYIPN